jgi:hypothetical protein
VPNNGEAPFVERNVLQCVSGSRVPLANLDHNHACRNVAFFARNDDLVEVRCLLIWQASSSPRPNVRPRVGPPFPPLIRSCAVRPGGSRMSCKYSPSKSMSKFGASARATAVEDIAAGQRSTRGCGGLKRQVALKPRKPFDSRENSRHGRFGVASANGFPISATPLSNHVAT